MKKILIFTLAIFLFYVVGYSQNVGINSTGATPDASAMLDVKSTNSGLLIPRINIPNLSAAAPVTSPAVSLLVYNINAGTGVGYCYWTGTQWMRLASAGDLNFVNGTGTATRVAFWTNSTSLGSNANLYWDNSNGRLGIGTGVPASQLHTTGAVRFANYASGTNGAVLRTNNFGDLLFTNFTGNSSDVLLGTGAFGAAVTSATAWQLSGNASTNPATNFIGTTDAQDFVIRTTNTERIRVATSGNVGVGTAPHTTYKAQIAGDVLLTSGWLRTTGSTGWFSETFGGGWNMVDATWIRSYGGKSIYHEVGIMRTDGTLQVGLSGGTLNVPNEGNFAYRTNVLFANTSGNVGVGTAAPSSKLDVQGGNLNVGTLYGTYVMNGTLASFDTRATNPNPEVYNMGVTSEFKANTANGLNDGGSYNSALSIRQWGSGNDMSGGGVHQMGFTQNGNIWHRYSQTLGTWGAWSRLHDSSSGGLITCGTANYVVKSDGTNGVCSQIFDNGTNVGIATSSPSEKLTIAGGYGDTKLRLYSTGNGSDQPANLSLWASEPGVTYYGTGIGYNVNGHPHYGRIDATRGSAYIRFLPTETKFEFQNSSGSTINDVMVVKETGRVGISTSNPGAKLDIKDHANSGIMLYLTDDDSSTGELDHKAIQVQTQSTVQSWVATNGDAFFNGKVGIGTSTPTEKLEVNGNAKATGYITAGTATTGSTTRYGSEEFTYDSQYAFDADGYRYINIGSISLPAGASSISIKSIVWECDAAHEDANEDHGIWVGVGATTTGTTYYGYGASVSTGYHYIDWHFVEDDLSQSATSTSNNVYIRLEDEDCLGCGGDRTILYNMHAIISYTYSVALQSGDIAASGRVYANNTHSVGDLAEHFEYKGPAVPGYVVSYVPGSDNEYEMCNQAYSDHITGIISENPSVVLNSPEQGPPLALAGRVKVKLVNSDELIKGGDFITSSSTPGLGMKATKPGPVIGYAVKNQKSGEDFVEILLQPGKYYIPVDYQDTENLNETESTSKRPGKY